jgi:gliding motility-associated lipoprotein GldD
MKMMKKVNYISLLFVFILILSCENDDVNPRPFGYFRIDLPEVSYNELGIDCPYIFEYSDQAIVVMKDANKCWINLYYPKHKATIYLTYMDVNDNLRQHLKHTQKLTYDHQIKATRIDRLPITNEENKVYGLKYRLEGDVASYVQFYLTDSTDHFLRGALYFDAYVNSDSLRPVVEYLDLEIQHLVETFHWKE